MKIRICNSLFFSLWFSGISLAQAPAPPLVGSLAAPEVSINLLLPMKDHDLSHYGFGGQLTATQFLDPHIGIQVQGDYVQTHGFDFHDRGVRVGPTIRFSTKHSIRPYMHALLGYSQVKATYLNPKTSLNSKASYHGSGSLLGGGGVEFPLSDRLFGKVGADIQYDWTVRTRLVRGLLGVSYRFGAGPNSL